MSLSLDDHVGSLQERVRNWQPQGLGSLEIDDKFKFHGLLDWHVRERSTLQYFGYKPCMRNVAFLDTMQEPCVLYPRKPTLASAPHMSAFGGKADMTFCAANCRSVELNASQATEH